MNIGKRYLVVFLGLLGGCVGSPFNIEPVVPKPILAIDFKHDSAILNNEYRLRSELDGIPSDRKIVLVAGLQPNNPMNYEIALQRQAAISGLLRRPIQLYFAGNLPDENIVLVYNLKGFDAQDAYQISHQDFVKQSPQGLISAENYRKLYVDSLKRKLTLTGSNVLEELANALSQMGWVCDPYGVPVPTHLVGQRLESVDVVTVNSDATAGEIKLFMDAFVKTVLPGYTYSINSVGKIVSISAPAA